MTDRAAPEETTTHRGIRWRRDKRGRTSFYDEDGERWVAWGPKVDAPPLPPGWGTAGVERAPWRSAWRIVPIVVVVFAVVVAIFQATGHSTNNAAKEAAAAQALLGKCLAQHGTFEGHPKYTSSAVACDSPAAAVKVVRVLAPGTGLCPSHTTGMTLGYAGVPNPHILCVQPVR